MQTFFFGSSFRSFLDLYHYRQSLHLIVYTSCSVIPAVPVFSSADRCLLSNQAVTELRNEHSLLNVATESLGGLKPATISSCTGELT